MKNRVYFKLVLSIFLIVIAIAFMVFYICTPRVYSKQDLAEISGHIQDYKFIATKSSRGEDYDYTFRLIEQEKEFQIIADFIDHFNRPGFEQTVKPGDKLFIYVPRKDSPNIFNNRIKAFGIRNNTDIFLDAEESIAEYNSQAPLFLIIAIMIAGIVGTFHYADKVSKIRKKHSH